MTKTVEELTDALHACQQRLADISGSTLEVDRVLQRDWWLRTHGWVVRRLYTHPLEAIGFLTVSAFWTLVTTWHTRDSGSKAASV